MELVHDQGAHGGAAADADEEGAARLEEARAELSASSPLERFVDPKNIAAAVAFLASDDAASITGEDFNVTAGLTMY